MEQIPPLSVDLIKQLDQLYPLRNPRPDESLVEIQRYAGKRDVVEYLKLALEKTNAKSPNKKLLGGS